jgi:hypothetical protein
MIVREAAAHDARHMAIHPTADAIAIGSGLNQASAKVTRRLKKLLGDDAFEGVVDNIRGVRSALK